MYFNNKFKIISQAKAEALEAELIKFSGKSFSYYKKDKENSLQIWDHIENDGFQLLSKIAIATQTLPTSSASIEQSFSMLKLIKTDKRNRLSENNFQSLIMTL